MLKLRLRRTGKTPYDSNQQLSLQATINPSALFIKLDATSGVPERQAPAEKYGTDGAPLPERGRAIGQQRLNRSHGYAEGFFRNVCPQGTPAALTTVNLAKRAGPATERETLDRELNTRRASATDHFPPSPV